jgi:hypothetical protein
MFNAGFLSPMVTENATSVILDLMRFYTNQANIQDNVNRIIGEREQLLAAAAKLSDLEHRAEQLEIDRHQLLSSVETDRRIVAEERELVSLHRGILSKDQEDHRLAVALLAAERAELEFDRRAHAEEIAAVQRLKGLLQQA